MPPDFLDVRAYDLTALVQGLAVENLDEASALVDARVADDGDQAI